MRAKMVIGPLQFSAWTPRTYDSRLAQSDAAKAAAETPVGRVALAAKITRRQAAKALAAAR
jgi:hypothetical protein